MFAHLILLPVHPFLTVFHLNPHFRKAIPDFVARSPVFLCACISAQVENKIHQSFYRTGIFFKFVVFQTENIKNKSMIR